MPRSAELGYSPRLRVTKDLVMSLSVYVGMTALIQRRSLRQNGNRNESNTLRP